MPSANLIKCHEIYSKPNSLFSVLTEVINVFIFFEICNLFYELDVIKLEELR